MGVALQLLAIAGSAGATIAYVAYRFGRLEERVTMRLDEHERRLGVIERRQATPYASV